MLECEKLHAAHARSNGEGGSSRGEQAARHGRGLRMVSRAGGGTGPEIKFTCEQCPFAIAASYQLASALGLAAPAPGGRCVSVQAGLGRGWEIACGGAGRRVWWVPEARARVARRWVADQQLREMQAATGLPLQSMRVLPPRDCDLEPLGSYMRTCIEVVSSRDVPLSVIRQSCDGVLRAFTDPRGSVLSHLSHSADALSRVLTCSVSEGMVPPSCPRTWQRTGAHVLASAPDVEGEAAHVSRMVLPALRFSCARRRVDLRWTGVRSPFCAEHRLPEGLALARRLWHLQRHRLPGGKAPVERGPRLFVALVAEMIEAVAPSQKARVRGDMGDDGTMGAVGMLLGAGALWNAEGQEAFVLVRDPGFMLTSAFKSLSLQAPTVRRCFTEETDDALQASKDLKRRIWETIGKERALQFRSAFRGRAVDVDEALQTLEALRLRLLMCEEMKVPASEELQECKQELLARLAGAREFLVEHFRLSRDARVRLIAEDDDLRALCESAVRAQGSRGRVPSALAARAARLDVEEVCTLVFASMAGALSTFCEAAPLEQPLHRHLVEREQQERRVQALLERCIVLPPMPAAAAAAAAAAAPGSAAVECQCRADVRRRLDAFVEEEDARRAPPVLLLEGAPFSGKSCLLAQWAVGRHDSLLPLSHSGTPAAPRELAGFSSLSRAEREAPIGAQTKVARLQPLAAPTRHVVVLVLAHGMSPEELLVHLALEVSLQWYGTRARDAGGGDGGGVGQGGRSGGARQGPEALDGRFDALLSGKASATSVAACAQALRQTILQVALAGGRLVLAVDGLSDEAVVLLAEVVRRCHAQLLDSLPYRALADSPLDAGDGPGGAEGEEEAGGGAAVGSGEAGRRAEEAEVAAARKRAEAAREAVQRLEQEISSAVTSAQTLQDWQRCTVE